MDPGLSLIRVIKVIKVITLSGPVTVITLSVRNFLRCLSYSVMFITSSLLTSKYISTYTALF